MSEALSRLRAEAERTSIAAAAERCGISRPAASMLLRGVYGAGTTRVEVKIMAALGRVSCPHFGRDITVSECRETAAAPMRTGSPGAVQQWRACRACPNKEAASC